MPIAALPLTANGKVDRRALPRPDLSAATSDRVYVAPRSPVELALAAIWGELLDVKQVSVDDDFFDLGGHSLLATRMIARVRERLHLQVPLRALFEAPALADFAQRLGALQWATQPPADWAGSAELDRVEIEL
jgi:acyl carrier protein